MLAPLISFRSRVRHSIIRSASSWAQLVEAPLIAILRGLAIEARGLVLERGGARISTVAVAQRGRESQPCECEALEMLHVLAQRALCGEDRLGRFEIRDRLLDVMEGPLGEAGTELGIGDEELAIAGAGERLEHGRELDQSRGRRALRQVDLTGGETGADTNHRFDGARPERGDLGIARGRGVDIAQLRQQEGTVVLGAGA